MARRRRQTLAFPVRRPARAAGASGLLALAALSRRMAARRMAAGRKRADQVLAFDLAGRHRHRNPRCNRQNALADRARLSGTQAGTGGFKWSSQHLDGGGCDEHSKAALGSFWADALVLTWSTVGGRARGAAAIVGREL